MHSDTRIETMEKKMALDMLGLRRLWDTQEIHKKQMYHNVKALSVLNIYNSE